MSSLYAVIGLGNPGNKYSNTKHNVGFNTIDCLAEKNNVKLSKIKFKSVYGETMIDGNKVILVKPQTYMNNSGISVMEILKYTNVPIDNIIVIYDDIDIELGSLRIRKKGSAGSHNGMKSIIYHLKSEDFPRIRLGIGKPNQGQDLANYVINNFGKEDRELIDTTIERASEAVLEIIKNGVDQAMNIFNKRK
ncbi:aminoacyl-tRNA hydrolase [Abyssisolibacter fermentans]|uniref:aminoacyl-tRNA hydrolase n=1 Tax=Abyssisolibacter fermentans TaxID=1766203 RepID=UPI0012E34462